MRLAEMREDKLWTKAQDAGAAGMEIVRRICRCLQSRDTGARGLQRRKRIGFRVEYAVRVAL